LTQSADTGVESQQPTPTVPEAVAHWLLATEAGRYNDHEELAVVGERVYHRLRTHLMVLLGANGFDALWARAVHLAQPNFRAGDDTAAASLSTHGRIQPICLRAVRV
jgi:hypothetical protein